MPYSIKRADGTTINVPDNNLDDEFYDGTKGPILVGRNTVNYGASIAQNFLQMTENFASRGELENGKAMQGQIQFRQDSTNPTTTGDLWVKTNRTTGNEPSTWNRLLSITPTGAVNVANGTITAAQFVGGGVELTGVVAAKVASTTVFEGSVNKAIFQGTQYKFGRTLTTAAPAIDYSLGNYFKWTPLAGNITFPTITPDSLPAGNLSELILECVDLGNIGTTITSSNIQWQLPGSGGYTATFTTYLNTAGITLQKTTPTATGVDWIVLWTDAATPTPTIYGKVIR